MSYATGCLAKETPCNCGECPYGAASMDDCLRYGPAYEPRYTIMYEGYLFDGDTTGLNVHDMDSWSDVQGVIDAYGEIVEVQDNEYGVTWSHGSWT